MALVIPTTTLLTASANTMNAYMAALRTHFGGSAKFTIKANGDTDDGFTLVPAAGGEDYEINFRRVDGLVAHVSIDPLENITAPGNTGSAPTLADASEWSGEFSSWQIAGGGAEHVDFYVLELDDWICILHMNATPDATPRAIQVGRTYVPGFTDGVNGDHYADGLGVHGYLPLFTASLFT